MRQVFEQMPEGICLLDAGCRPAMTSPFARALLDEAGTFEEGRLVALGGRPVNELLGPRGDGMPHDLTLAGEPPRCIEVRSCRLEKGPLEGGQIVQLRDATRERATQCQQERQAHLAAIGQLAAGIAHDFNNLLTSILGSAELLQTEPDPAHCQADLERILHSGRRAAQLVRQILDFSRKSMPARQPIDLVPLVKEMLDLLTRTLPETIRVEQALELEQCTVVADAGQLGQVLTNLAVNARDAMPDGGTLSVTVDARTIEPSAGPSPSRVAAGNWVVLSVTDTGTGIPRKVLEHIFEPFFTTKSAGRGTGLGLAQVYGIVQQHGGSIQVNTRVGLGTTFSVWLPRATSACSGDRPVGSDRPRGSGERVLLVEDDPQVRGMLCKLLTRLGYRVDSAPSGLEALARFESDTSTPDLVLSDVVMPGLTGVELLRRLRASGQTVPVVLMSGYPMGEVIPESAAAAWLEKPASPETLATVLRQALGPVRSRMGCRAAGESPTESSKPPTIPASHEEQARATRGQ
ncbi:MAG: response regulator [Candidatus Riflebacteria bacterium]|nr:response regulator [Candidatus Riflebacteria bacterium]